ncbi:unnamed protein product [Cercopithifilaria johnstoni]|uniref:Glycerol-3-phosphate dehydrogenase NAD-dependent C-terminal domain-containing protein n=1 Tax=Cercopithifilaria johnstoni TaxID=2874296 RepID=A0A8J2LZW5_9BILA|nr:unnamed protein product [Cercopithifilaria johnstoni]
MGLLKIILLVELFYYGPNIKTYFKNFGTGDFMATCTSGRNRKIYEAFIKTKKSIQELEQEMLNGQSFQDPATAEAIFVMLKKHNMISRFPISYCAFLTSLF